MRTSLDVQGEVFAVMLEQWGLSRPLVTAHDMGGATTLRAYLPHGCDFERLVLMDVVAIRPWGSEFFDHLGRTSKRSRRCRCIHRAGVDAYIRGAIVGELGDEDIEALVAPWLTTEGRESFYELRASRRALHTRDRAVVGRDSMSRAHLVGRIRPLDPAQARARTAPPGTANILQGAARHRPPSPNSRRQNS
jgi:pimeloyl-ACP methyl ester carboxylesterase